MTTGWSSELTRIAIDEGTDKAVKYTDTYDRLFTHLRDKDTVLVEIGIGWLNSIRLWHTAYPRWRIYGMDHRRVIRPHTILADLALGRTDVLRRNFFGSKVRLIHGDQRKPKDLQRLLRAVDSPIDVFIDDGSHDPRDQLATFRECYTAVTAGGYYIIEDVMPGSPVFTAFKGWRMLTVNETGKTPDCAVVLRGGR